MVKQAIVIVSFGSSYEEARQRSIGQIENEVKARYGHFRVYSAYLSEEILEKVRKKREEELLSLTECLSYLLKSGIEEVYLQPTFIICGKQYQRMIDIISTYEGALQKVAIGKPLLTTIQDFNETITAFVKSHPKLKENEAVICMGHGSDDTSSRSFATLDDRFKKMGYEQYYVATLRSYPTIAHVLRKLKKKVYHRIYLYPFTLVAGFHVANDLMDKAEAAWQSLLEKEGYEVVSCVRGLGEYPEIRSIYMRHVKALLGID